MALYLSQFKLNLLLVSLFHRFSENETSGIEKKSQRESFPGDSVFRLIRLSS